MKRGRPKSIKGRVTTLVYWPREIRDLYQEVADREGVSLSSVCRRVLTENAHKTRYRQ